MSTYPMFRFVSGPKASAEVRHDFSASTTVTIGGTTHRVRTKVLEEGWSIGAPTLEGDVDGVGVEYGERTLTVTQCIAGPKAAALQAQSRLAREILRDRNWLMFQLAEGTQPVWFRTYRAEPGDLSFDLVNTVSTSDHWHITVTVPAEPFAYGAEITLPPVTINNNPAATTNPCAATLPAVIGDAPAPARIEVNPSNPVYMNGYRWMLSLHAGKAAVPPVLWQLGADGFTLGADVTTVTNVAYSGGSARSVSFATQSDLVTRLSGVAPASLPRGRYKVMLRLARTDTASRFTARFGTNVGLGLYQFGETVTMDRASSTAAGHATWLDLGDFSFPVASAVPYGEEGFAYAPNVSLQIGRVAGGGNAHLDAILLVPLEVADTAETNTLFSHFHAGGIFIDGGRGVWDGDVEGFWAFTQFGALATIPPPEMVGGFPRLAPGAVNQLTLLQQVNGQRSVFGDDASDLLTASTAVTVSYHPRFLWIGDS